MGFGDMMKLLGQLGKIQEKMGEAKEKARKMVIEGQAGGGLVKITMNGAFEVLSVSIEPAALEDPESLGPLIVSATNLALGKAREQLKELFQETLGMPLPNLGLF
jgi:hypothetical protein